MIDLKGTRANLLGQCVVAVSRIEAHLKMLREAISKSWTEGEYTLEDRLPEELCEVYQLLAMHQGLRDVEEAIAASTTPVEIPPALGSPESPLDRAFQPKVPQSVPEEQPLRFKVPREPPSENVSCPSSTPKKASPKPSEKPKKREAARAPKKSSGMSKPSKVATRKKR